MTSRTRRKESGFSRYLRRVLGKDPKCRTLFLAELKRPPAASRHRVLQHFQFLDAHLVPSQ